MDSSPASPFYGTLYVAFGEEGEDGEVAPALLTYLRPGARRFTPPTAVSSLLAGFTQVATPFTGPDGALYIVFVARQSAASPSGIFLVESRDGGRSFGPTHLVASFRDPVDGQLPNTSYRVPSFPVAVFDPGHNRIVVAWNDRLGGVSSLLVSMAGPLDLDDWSVPARVTPTSSGEQFFPAISASPAGRIDLAFYDRSLDPFNRLNFLTYAWSNDGGRTWDSLNVTPTAFDGEAQTTPGGTSFIGDYIGIASTLGATHLAWTGNGRQTPCACNQDIFAATVSHVRE